MKTTELMDMEAFRKAFYGMEDVMISVIELFLEQLPLVLDNMASFIRNGDARGLELSAHSLKGMVAHFHAQGIRDLALALENIGHSKTTAGAMDIFPRLQKGLSELTVLLRALQREASL